MRISKPRTEVSGETNYLLFNDIQERNAAKEEFKNGEEIKVIDASGDSNIGAGWAIYKYDKENDSFDLLEKEEQPIIPNVIPPDNITIKVVDNKLEAQLPEIPESEKIKADDSSIIDYQFAGADYKVLGVPDSYNPFDERFKILEDFDFKFENYESSGIHKIKIEAENKGQIKVKVNGVIKYLTLHQWTIDFESLRTSESAEVGGHVYFILKGSVTNTETFAPHSSAANLSYLLDQKISYNAASQILFSARIELPGDGQPYDLATLKVWKHWKKALVPAEKRVNYEIPEIPNVIPPDNITIKVVDNKLQAQLPEIPEIPNVIPPDNITIKVVDSKLQAQLPEILESVKPDEKSIYYDANGKLLSFESMYTNQHHFRVFEDFDYQVEIVSESTIRISPRLGNRIVKASKFGNDLHLHLNHVNIIIQQQNRNKWQHWRIVCKLTGTDIETLQPVQLKYYDDKPVSLYPSENYAASVFYLRVFIPESGQINETDVQAYQLHKKYLGTFDELMQNYKQRNP